MIAVQPMGTVSKSAPSATHCMDAFVKPWKALNASWRSWRKPLLTTWMSTKSVKWSHEHDIAADAPSVDATVSHPSDDHEPLPLSSHHLHSTMLSHAAASEASARSPTHGRVNSREGPRGSEASSARRPPAIWAAPAAGTNGILMLMRDGASRTRSSAPPCCKEKETIALMAKSELLALSPGVEGAPRSPALSGRCRLTGEEKRTAVSGCEALKPPTTPWRRSVGRCTSVGAG